MNLEKIGFDGLEFYIRPETSDIKAIEEVVVGNAYRRKGFEIEDSGLWLDLGANIGAFAILAASKGCRVVAVEADPVNAELTRKNVALNGLRDRIKVVERAVMTSDSGFIEMHVNSARGNYWRNSVFKKWKGGETIPVKTVAIESLIEPGMACKMDIEGAEMPILEAMDSRWFDRLVFEWSFDIDRSIPRFNSVVEKLDQLYSNVWFGSFDQSQPVWPGSWFPPARNVWCYDTQD